MRIVAHVDMDAFYASVAGRERESPHGKLGVRSEARIHPVQIHGCPTAPELGR